MKKNRAEEFIQRPKKALFVLALPMMAGMIIQTLYNVVDTAFIGRLGAENIAAITFSFPLFFILISLNSGVNVGMGSLISRFLGSQEKEKAENVAMHGLLVSAFFALLIFSLGKIFIHPLFAILGAQGDVLALAIDYMSIVFVSILFMFLAFAAGGILSAQGDTKTPMIAQVSALVVNIILDPILIYYFHMGIKGAALATLIAFIFGVFISFYFLIKRSYLKIHISSFQFSPKIIKDIFSVGLPASLMMLLISFFTIIANRFLSSFGTETIAAFGVVSRLESIYIMPMVSFSMAMTTLVGMFYGAKRFDLLEKIIWYGIKMTVLISVSVGAIFFFLPSLFVKIFTTDKELIKLSSDYLKIAVFYFPFAAITMPISRALQGMGFGFPGLVINLVRMIIVAVPLAYAFIFVFGYGYLSVAVALIIGGIASSILAVGWLRFELQKVENR